MYKNYISGRHFMLAAFSFKMVYLLAMTVDDIVLVAQL